MENFPKDFSQLYINEILTVSGNPKAKPSEWEKWINKFKAQYLSFGCEVE